jgi:Domain of unknown function (DUF5671)
MASGAPNLDAFVRDALLHGQSRAEITRVLLEAGWPAQQVSLALGAYADTTFPVPVPRPRASVSAREAFLYLVLFTALYMSAYNFGHILFELIDAAVPDAAAAQSYLGNDELRSSLAALIVAFPVFLWTSWYIGRETAKNPAGRLSPVRRWCSYVTLFIAVASLIADATALVKGALEGELTTRFLLKVLVVLAIAGSVLWYYLRDLRHGEQPT